MKIEQINYVPFKAALSNPFAARHMWRRMAYIPNMSKFGGFKQNFEQN